MATVASSLPPEHRRPDSGSVDAHGRTPLERERIPPPLPRWTHWTAHARRCFRSQPDPLVPTEHFHPRPPPRTGISISISISDPLQPAGTFSISPADRRAAGSERATVCARSAATEFSLHKTRGRRGGGWGQKGNEKKGRDRGAGQPAWCGWFRARASATLLAADPNPATAAAAPPAGPPSDRSPRPPWQAPWWTAPPATCSSARTGLRTWRSATSATATPGTYPHSPRSDPSQIRAAPPPGSLPPARFHAYCR